MKERQFHQPVMLTEIIEYFDPSPGQIYIDCTLGGAGHTEKLLEMVSPDGKVLGIDLDPKAIKAAVKSTKKYKGQIIIVKENFKNLNQIAKSAKFKKVDGILLDLGLSSGELADLKRGFSFHSRGRLDMRFGSQTELTAEEIINDYSEAELSKIFYNFGQERLAKPISKKISEIRRSFPIVSPDQLADIVSDIYSNFYKKKSKIHPATKVFQALRIAVNDELKNLTEVLPFAVKLLKPGGRLAVISYHSLEDKIVKDFFKIESKGCICPVEIPECRCKHQKNIKIITRKPVVPSDKEIKSNPRARSAKLRVVERIKK